MNTATRQLSKMRSFLLWAFVVVWFSEMILWGVRPLAESWTLFWQQLPPEDPQLASALYITHALESTVKGALGVLAVYAVRSGNPAVRLALFVPMALVPPLNLAFQFRAQGFPVGPTTVGTVFSLILWGSFLLFRDHAGEPPKAAARPEPSRWQTFRTIWLIANATLLTAAAALFLLAPDTGLRVIFPCLTASLDVSRGVPPGLTHGLMAVGTHVMAVSIAVWIAIGYAPSHPTSRQAVMAANLLLTGLIVVLPLRQILQDFGQSCAGASLLRFAVPWFTAWVVYVGVSYRISRNKDARRD